MALGLLEILHNAHLLYDKRYYNFTTQLRDIVLDKIGDYRNLKSRYSYTIVADKPFWYRGRKKGRGTMTNLNIFLHQTAYL
jgi:predicted dehydrogenase